LYFAEQFFGAARAFIGRGSYAYVLLLLCLTVNMCAQCCCVLCCNLQKEQSLGASWASIGRGTAAKKVENVTAPTNRLMSAECDEQCLFNADVWLCCCAVPCCVLQKEQSLGAAWASIGRGGDAKKVENITAPTNRLVSAECDEHCGFNNRDVLNGTAMDAGVWGCEGCIVRLNPNPSSPKP
jgi:hypothetical protein